MHIVLEIIDKKVSLMLKMGKDPVNIYLGRKQMEDLYRWAADNSYGTEKGNNSRKSVHGLFIYAVDDDDHCGFGF